MWVQGRALAAGDEEILEGDRKQSTETSERRCPKKGTKSWSKCPTGMRPGQETKMGRTEWVSRSEESQRGAGGRRVSL